MNRYLKASGKFKDKCKQGSKLVLKRLKSPTVYDEGTGAGVTVPQRSAAQLGPKFRLEDCGNTFIADAAIEKPTAQGSERLNLTEAAARLKGCNRVVQRFQNMHKLYSQESHVYQCDFFRLMYFPPDHFLSLFRKSKPAVNVRTVGQAFLNGSVSSGKDTASKALFQRNSQKTGFLKTQSTTQGLSKLFESNPSNIPRNYAFLRRQLRVMLRKSFAKEWWTLKGDLAVQEAASAPGSGAIYTDSHGRAKVGVAKDGYYMYQVLIFPDKVTRKEFESCVSESVEVVSKLEWDEFLKPRWSKNKGKTWVQLANDRVRIPSLNSSLKSHDMPLAVQRV